LGQARAERRVVITAGLDYPRLLVLAGNRAPGLILSRGGNFSEHDSLAHLERVLSVVPEADLASCIIVVEKDRIRRRRLPIEPILKGRGAGPNRGLLEAICPRKGLDASLFIRL